MTQSLACARQTEPHALSADCSRSFRKHCGVQHEKKSVPTSVKNIPLHWAAGRVRPPRAVVRRRHPPGRA
eukprot:scaffold12538_cov60-Phaeocystis_antarctica.AAC.1